MSDHYPLYQFSDEVLVAELERRRKKVSEPPKPLSDPDFSGLEKMVINHVEDQARREATDETSPFYIYEAVLRIVYGQAYFDWRNKQKW